MTDARITIASEALLREADRLSGASPAMTSSELQALFAGLTRDKLVARARMLALSRTRDSEERGKLVEAITLQAAENPSVRTLLSREFPEQFRITAGRASRPGRPRVSDAQRRAARRAASRAYRDRSKGTQATETEPMSVASMEPTP